MCFYRSPNLFLKHFPQYSITSYTTPHSTWDKRPTLCVHKRANQLVSRYLIGKTRIFVLRTLCQFKKDSVVFLMEIYFQRLLRTNFSEVHSAEHIAFVTLTIIPLAELMI